MTTVTIIGGGLSGLLVAYRLANAGIDFNVIEANTRLGGRILSPVTAASESNGKPQPAIDLGPSWFWPGQSKMDGLLRELNMSEFVYPQASIGDSVMEYSDGSIRAGYGSASMAGSYRLSGGMYHLIERLVAALPAAALITDARVTQVERCSTGMVAVTSLNGNPGTLYSQQVVLALPPRVVANTIAFVPALSEDYLSTLLAVPTWMAGEAKFVAVYSEPFWQQKGLSGDAMSQLGPLVEIHDASPEVGGPYALFGFVGVPAAQRLDRNNAVQSAALEQLVRMFGKQAGSPLSVHYKDWASDPLIAVHLDSVGPRMHASVTDDLVTGHGHNVLWAGTETAEHTNGYLEGALEAGERAASQLLERLIGSQ